MTADTPTPDAGGDALQEQPAPACVMSFNASDPSGAGGLAGDVSTIAAMGAHALPVVTQKCSITTRSTPMWSSNRRAASSRT
jgi:hydroxymethylpyrimidine/phosphomethylpyrimidine kinase